MHLEPLSIYETAEYFSELATRIQKTNASSRIALMSMSLEPTEPHIHALMRDLIAAAKRGVAVYLTVDALAFGTTPNDLPIGPTMLLQDISATQRPYFKRKIQLLEELLANGGHYRIVNLPHKRLANPYAGRSHIKIAVIDDIAFIGGCNLNTIQTDFMVRLTNRAIADQLYRLAVDACKDGNIGHVFNYIDQTIQVDEKTTLFIDAGKPKQSLIYENALSYIDAAQEWLVMTCQYFPNNTTAKHLAAAVRRGVDVTLCYNHPRHHAIHMRPLHQGVILFERIRQPNVLFAKQLPKKSRRLHAKLIASEQGAMIGSHNYVTQGVNFGTAEIAIRRDDPAFAKAALKALKKQLPASYAGGLPI